MEYRYGVIEVDPADDPVRRQGLPIAWVVAVCVAVVLFYAVAYAHRHLRMPAGDDALFYVVGLRSVARLGLQDPQLAVRPAFPLAGSVLATVTGSSAWTMAAAAPIAFAAGTGLAAAAIAARWRLRGAGLAAFAFLAAVSGVVARLVAGKVENGMALWLMAAVLAVTVWGGRPSGNVLPWTTGDRVRRSPAGSSIRRQWVLRGAPVTALVGAMTLVEWPLAVTFAAIVAAAWTWSWLVGRRRDAAGGGIESSELLLRLLVLASLAGVALGLLVAFVWNGAGPGAGIQNLPPGYRYGARLRDELSLARPFWTAPLLVVGLLVAWRRERHPAAAHSGPGGMAGRDDRRLDWRDDGRSRPHLPRPVGRASRSPSPRLRGVAVAVGGVGSRTPATVGSNPVALDRGRPHRRCDPRSSGAVLVEGEPRHADHRGAAGGGRRGRALRPRSAG